MSARNRNMFEVLETLSMNDDNSEDEVKKPNTKKKKHGNKKKATGGAAVASENPDSVAASTTSPKENNHPTAGELHDNDGEETNNAAANRAAAKEISHGPFSHPVYKKISFQNGEINKMTKIAMKERLEELGLSSLGHKDVLKKRLKTYYKTKHLARAHIRGSSVAGGGEDDASGGGIGDGGGKITPEERSVEANPGGAQGRVEVVAAAALTVAPASPAVKANTEFRYLVVIDFEATCHETNPPDYIHEIIEFPAVLIDTRDLRVVDEFHSFCRPVVHTELTQFCKNLTGISQAVVDAARPFCEVIRAAETWLQGHGLPTGRAPSAAKSQGAAAADLSAASFAIVTDGPYDMSRFMRGQCELNGLPVPHYARKWINVRKVFSNFYRVPRPKLSTMLDVLDMKFEGTPHCGRDDARNIARIVVQLLRDGAELRINERLHQGPPTYSRFNWTKKDTRPAGSGAERSGHTTPRQQDDSQCQQAMSGGGYDGGGFEGGGTVYYPQPYQTQGPASYHHHHHHQAADHQFSCAMMRYAPAMGGGHVASVNVWQGT